MNFLEHIQKKNQFPILFVGSGITQRYFKNAPTWEALLIKLWSYVHEKHDFYTCYHELSISGKDSFEIYLLIAKKLEKEIDLAFYRNELSIPNLDVETAHQEKRSPFRQLIVNIFSSLEKKEEMVEEVDAFSEMMIKARFVITTNYDCFIEACYQRKKVGIKVNVGNAGLFKKSNDYGELYKIHGSLDDPCSICITESDYQKNEAKLALVNARILSNLVDSPILFLGYSLTDEHVRSLIETYAENMPFNPKDAASRIGVVNWMPGENQLTYIREYDPKMKVHFTRIETDHYLEIYRQIAAINQGFLPSEIAKYERAFRRIIEVKGPTKGLDTILTSFEDLSSLTDEQIGHKHIVVAFGDSRYVYRMPTYADYIRDYFSNKSEMSPEVALGFLARQKLSTPIPIKKYVITFNQIQGMNEEKKIFGKRQKKYETFWENVEKLPVSQKDLPVFRATGIPLDIYCLVKTKERSRINYIIKNMNSFQLSDVALLINEILTINSDNYISKTEYRKLFMAYSTFL